MKELRDGLLTTTVGQPSLSGDDKGTGTTFAVGRQGVHKNGKGKLKTRYTWSTIRDQTKGELTLCKPNEGKNSVSLKIFFREIEGEGEETDYIKKKRGVGSEDLTVEARSQPRRQQ